MARKLTQEEVISRLYDIYGDSLDFSKVEYKNNTTPICVICPIHGEQWVRPDVLFKSKKGCYECVKEYRAQMRRIPTDEIIRRATEVHKGYFTYDRESIDRAKSNKDHIIAICPKHGPIDVQIGSHLKGYGCRKCSGKEKKTTESYIAEAKAVWGDLYDYSPLEYRRIFDPIQFICPQHGLVEVRAFDHLRGHGCPKCGNERKSESKRISHCDYINRVSVVHSNYYSYPHTKYKGMHYNIIVTCPIHGDFEIEAVYHLNGGGCPYCTSVSKGESLVRSWLIDNGIEFTPQYEITPTVLSLFGRNKFRVDFFLPKHNTIIEYHGEQHYKYAVFFHESELDFMRQQDRDNRLRDYCKMNGITLIEIPYTKIKEIDKILSKKIGSHK